MYKENNSIGGGAPFIPMKVAHGHEAEIQVVRLLGYKVTWKVEVPGLQCWAHRVGALKTLQAKQLTSSLAFP